jgi:hypothetical protein
VPRAHGLAFCPRCGFPTVYVSDARRACTSRKCSWPNPEPGLITTTRLTLGARANSVLQRARKRGLWPPKPRY